MTAGAKRYGNVDDFCHRWSLSSREISDPIVLAIRATRNDAAKMCHLYKAGLPVIAALSVYMSATMSAASEVDNLVAEDKAIAAANSSLDRIYQKIIANLDSQIAAGEEGSKSMKQALVEAERTWIKWRDAEALWRAYSGGAVGGSALNEDLHSALLTLIKERQEYLESVNFNN